MTAASRPGRLTLVSIPTALVGATCSGCAGRMVATGRFAIEVEGRGRLCNRCIEPYVPAGLFDLVLALEEVGNCLDEIQARAASTARRFVVDACLLLTTPPTEPHGAEQPAARGTGAGGPPTAGTGPLRRSA